MKRKNQRRLGLESLEPRLVLNSMGLGAGPPDLEWQSVIVSFHDHVANPRAAAQGLVAAHGGALGHVYEHALKGFSAQLPAPAAAALARSPQVKLVEQDLMMHTFAQTVPTGVQRIAADRVGSGPYVDASKVNIAIIDTGIDGSHPDLNVVGGVRFYSVTGGPPSQRGKSDDQFYDDNGHGTHVAGIAAASDNGEGVGVAPGARLWAVKVLAANGSGSTSDIIAGIDWVTSTRTDGIVGNDIHVANMSLGGTGKLDAYHTAIKNSVAKGVVYVVAAGNSGRDIHGSDKTFNTSDDFIPAAYPEVATISAFVDTDGQPGGGGPSWYWSAGSRWLADDTFADFSNFSNSDETKNQVFLDANIAILGQERHGLGLGIDMVLPGVAIRSTYLNGGYATMSGTSMAAPHAAGLAALHIAANGPAINAAGVYEIRQALIDAGKRWRDLDFGLIHPAEGGNSDSPDKYEENLGWAGSAVVDLSPTVTISTPGNGPELWDVEVVIITARAVAAAGTEVSEVLFQISMEDVLVTTLTGDLNGSSNEWEAAWDTTELDDNNTLLYPDGTYTITAVATTTSGTASDSITVFLDNFDDPPTVEITSPADGATVSGTVVITATADDDRGVVGVQFEIYEVGASAPVKTLAGMSTEGTWSATWYTKSEGYSDGKYSIKAIVTDSSLQIADRFISVNVNNSVATTMTATLTGWPETVNRNFWRAYATVTVVAANQLLSDATVTGSWNGSNITGTTDASGEVTFDSGNLSTKNVTSITFSLTDVVFGNYEYVSGQTSIQIYQNGNTTVASASLYDQLAAWQAMEQAQSAKPKSRILAAETVDYLMTLEV